MMRRSVVAGQFYPGTKSALTGMIEKFFKDNFGEVPGVQRGTGHTGALCPHAGYVYSGPTAAHSFHEIARRYPDTFIIVGPNHTGRGSPLAIMTQGSWETPLGISEIDSESAHSIHEKSGMLDDDESAFRYEHSLEVQLPFIQYLGNSCIVPICMSIQDEETSRDMGRAIAEVIRESKKSFCILASSDLTHFGANYGFVPTRQDALAWIRKTDTSILNAAEGLDTHALFEVGKKTTACGVGCIGTMVEAEKALGAKRGRILAYTTSADVSGSTDLVVGYGSLIVE
jgi:AmmeMemoRadiSam system protein B